MIACLSPSFSINFPTMAEKLVNKILNIPKKVCNVSAFYPVVY